MFWLAFVLFGFLALFLWLKQTTEKEATIDTSVYVRMNDLLDFMCSPVNMEQYHPYVQKITDIEATRELVNFRMEENLRFGKQNIPMMLRTYQDSQFTAILRLENNSNFVKVIITFNIMDNTKEDKSSGQPSCGVKLMVHVKAPRFFNFFMVSHLEDVWTKALNKTKSILEH